MTCASACLRKGNTCDGKKFKIAAYKKYEFPEGQTCPMFTYCLPCITTNSNQANVCGSCGSSLLSLEVISPAQILLIVQITAIRHLNFSFSSFHIPLFQNLEICSYLFLLFFPVFFSALYLNHPSILFYCSFCLLSCFLSFCLFTLFFDLSCVLFLNLLSFLFFSLFL